MGMVLIHTYTTYKNGDDWGMVYDILFSHSSFSVKLNQQTLHTGTILSVISIEKKERESSTSERRIMGHSTVGGLLVYNLHIQ